MDRHNLNAPFVRSDWQRMWNAGDSATHLTRECSAPPQTGRQIVSRDLEQHTFSRKSTLGLKNEPSPAQEAGRSPGTLGSTLGPDADGYEGNFVGAPGNLKVGDFVSEFSSQRSNSVTDGTGSHRGPGT